MTAVDVDALDAARAAATPGEWVRDVPGMIHNNPTGRVKGGYIASVEHAEDAALIVAAVNALPDLLAEVRRGRALREAVERLAESYAAGGWVGTDVADSLRAVLAAVDAS